jgi:hypothetical protein
VRNQIELSSAGRAETPFGLRPALPVSLASMRKTLTCTLVERACESNAPLTAEAWSEGAIASEFKEVKFWRTLLHALFCRRSEPGTPFAFG